jgi:hypothetical protein
MTVSYSFIPSRTHFDFVIIFWHRDNSLSRRVSLSPFCAWHCLDYFTDLTEETDTESQMSGKVSGSFGYWGIKAELSAERKSTSKNKWNTHVVASTMRIERYYSSIKEESSDLSSDAFELLDNRDYIGFFKACGPNYVRSIRRAQEVTAIFTFTSENIEEAQDFAASLKVSGYGQSVEADYSGKSSMQTISKSLTIKILGYGLGLNQAGSETLVASSLEEYNKVMKFAFQSMTQDGGSGQTGMVYGIEIVPWVDNTAFQVASKLLQEDISVPMPRSLIPKALLKGSAKMADPDTVFSTDDRNKFRCKESSYQIDKHGYCCADNEMYDPRNGEEDASEGDDPSKDGKSDGEDPNNDDERVTPLAPGPDKKICRPLRSLDPSIMKNNMANNGEFVALLDSTLRYKINTMFTLEKCITAVRSFPKRYEYHILKSMDTVKYDASIEAEFTVAELKMAIDPMSDYSLVNHMASELDEFMDMFYSPCLAALFGTNIGTTPDTDPKYFMAESWYNHDACTKLSCLADNMHWNRDGGSCVSSLMTGTDAPTSVGGECTMTVDEVDGSEQCKYKSDDILKYATDVKQCWNSEKLNPMVPVYLMEHFCMPQLSGAEADEERKEEIIIMKKACAPGAQ